MHGAQSPEAQRNASHARRLCLRESALNTHPTARDTTFVLDMESDAKEEADESKAKTTGTSDDDGGIDSSRSGSSHGPITVEAAVAEEICKDLITSIAIEVAFDTHRMAKTGVLPLSQLMDPTTRSATSTSLGANKSRTRSSSFVPVEDDSEHGPPSKRSRSNTLASDGTGAGAGVGVGDIAGDAVNGTQQQQEQQQQQQPVGADIWGRIPPKEPKIMPKCDICGRQVSALRFAVHLDKCMNLGNSRQTGSRRTAS